MASTINASTSGVGGVITTADATGVLDLQTADVTRASVSSSGLKISRVDSSNEGGQLDLCRSSDNTSAWAIDVFGNTSTPSLRFVDNVAAASRASIDGSGNFAFNSGFGSVATAYGCRAWAKFTSTTTPSVSASGNITSVTYSATAQYTVAFTNAMPDANYSVVTGGNYNNAAGNFTYGTSIYSQSTTSFVIQTWAGGAPAVWNASGFVYFSVFR